MLTKNLTPFFFGTRLTSRKPPAPEMTMVVRGTFRIEDDALVPIEGIDQGFMSGDVAVGVGKKAVRPTMSATGAATMSLGIADAGPIPWGASRCPVRAHGQD